MTLMRLIFIDLTTSTLSCEVNSSPHYSLLTVFTVYYGGLVRTYCPLIVYISKYREYDIQKDSFSA